MIKTKSKKKVINQIIKKFGIKTKNYWKTILQTIPLHQVGVIRAGEDILEGKDLEQFAIELSYLCKETDFYLPIVIGPKIRFGKLASFKTSRKEKGKRVITKEMMDEITEIIQKTQDEVFESLKKQNIDAVKISYDEIRATPHGEELNQKKEIVDIGYFGEVVTIDTKPIIQAIYEKKIPIIPNLGVYKDETYLLNSTDLAAELVKYLNAKKMIILGDDPIKNREGGVIKAIYSELEAIKLIRNGTIKKAMIKNCKEAYELLNYLGPGHSVQITSLKYTGEKLESTGILEELLGNGSGTILLMPHIVTGYPFHILDKAFLNFIEEKINTSFKDQKKFLVNTYFKKISKKDATLYLDPKHKGGAITYPIYGAEYMCKLFTDKDYEGLGLGTSIIEHIFLQKGKVAWRTSVKNKNAIKMYENIIAHYKRNDIDTFITKKEKYKIFGIGVNEEDKENVIEFIYKLEKTLEEK